MFLIDVFFSPHQQGTPESVFSLGACSLRFLGKRFRLQNCLGLVLHPVQADLLFLWLLLFAHSLKASGFVQLVMQSRFFPRVELKIT